MSDDSPKPSAASELVHDANPAAASESQVSPIEVRLLTEAEDVKWDKALQGSSQRSWLQWLPWLRCVGRHVGRCDVVGVFRGGQLIAGVAGVVDLTQRPLLLRPVQLTAYHGLWLRDAELSPSRAESLTDEVARALVPHLNRHYERWVFTSAPELRDPRPFRDLGCDLDVYVTYRMPLTSPEEMLRRMDSAARRRVTRAQKAGVTFEVCEATEGNLAAFEAHAAATALRHGQRGESFPRGLFTDIARLALADGRAMLSLARAEDGRPASTLLCTWDDRRAYTFLGGSEGEFMSIGVARFLNWHALGWLAERGHREVDLLGGNLPELRAFKKQFNGVVVPYFTVSSSSQPRSRGQHLRAAAKHLYHALRG